MMASISKLLAGQALGYLPLKSRHLAAHGIRRYVRQSEFPEARMDNSTPKDYLLVLPEKLNETDNEILRMPQFGQPEIDFSKLNPEICYKGISQAICAFENYSTDVTNQISPPFTSLDGIFKDIERHLIPMDHVFSLFSVLLHFNNQKYAYAEFNDLIKRYHNVREARHQNVFKDSIEYHAWSTHKNLSIVEKKMLRIYHIRPRSSINPLSDGEMFLERKNLKEDINGFMSRLHLETSKFAHTVDDPDILASVSNDLEVCKDSHQSDRTPLQITSSTYDKFMQVCPDRFVRQMMWQTYNRLCSPKTSPKANNTTSIRNIRLGRRKIAEMSGYRSHFDYKLSDTMAGSRQRVLASFNKIHEDNEPKLYGRLEELNEFAIENGIEDANKRLREYDIDYWSQRYMHDILIGVSAADLKSYFPFETVLQGIKNYFNKFFSVEFKLKSKSGDTFWSEHVQLIELSRKGQLLGNVIYEPFYRQNQILDGFSRMNLRSRVQGTQIMPARLITSPMKINTKTGHAHMTLIEVFNLFYCFMEAIQEFLLNHQYHELSQCSALELDVKDFVPKLCMSHILSDHTILQSCSNRVGSKPIDSELTKRILRAILYFRPFRTWRDLYKANLDMESHTLSIDIKSIAENMYKKYSPFPRDPDNFDYCSMSDIFVGPNDGCKFGELWSRQLATFCLEHIQDQANGKVDEVKMKEFYDNLLELMYNQPNTSTDEKLTALVGERFEPSKTTLGVL